MPKTDLLASQTLFCRAATLGSITKAAQKMGVDPADASQRIEQLEHHLGSKLLQRTPRGCILTANGELYFGLWRTQVDLLDSLAERLSPKPKRTASYLRIAFPTTTGTTLLFPLLATFAANHSEIEFDVQFTHGSFHPLWDGIDLRIVHGEYRRELVRQIPLGAIRRTIVAGSQYLKNHAPIQTPEDLLRPELFGTRDTAERGHLTLRNGEKRIFLQIHPQIWVRNHIAALEAAKRNLGIALSVPRYLAQPWLNSGELVEVLPEWQPSSLPLRAVMPLERVQHPVIETFIDVLLKHFAEHEEPLS